MTELLLSEQIDLAYNPAEPRDAHGQWTKGLAGTLKYTAAEAAAVSRAWYNPDFYYTNEYARTGRIGGATAAKAAQIKSDAETFRAAILRSKPFTTQTTMYRGMTNGDEIFGKPGSMTGKTVTDKGFGSTTANLDFAKTFGRVRVAITMPPGTHALKADPKVYQMAKRKKGQAPLDVLQEYTLPPGTKFKITGDKVVSAGGHDYRVVSLQVIP